MPCRAASTHLRFAIVGFFLALSISVAGASYKPIVQTTWWPDPDTSLMWTGDILAAASTQTHSDAVAACAALQLGGYKDWRLPTVAEMKSVIVTTTIEDTYDTLAGQGTHLHTKTVDLGPESGPGYKFSGSLALDTWTSDQSDATHFIAFRADRNQFVTMPYKYLVTVDKATSFCVRTMDPSLRSLAASAHATAPVASIDALKDLATMYSVEHTTDLASLPAAIEQAKEIGAKASAARNPIVAGQAYNDAAYAEVLEGRFTDASAEFAVAHNAYKENLLIKANSAWAKRVAADAKTDPRTTTMWIALFKCDVARKDKNYAQAETDATVAVSIESEWAEGYGRLGETYEAENKWPQAIAAYKQGSTKQSHSTENLKAELKSALKSYTYYQKHR